MKNILLTLVGFLVFHGIAGCDFLFNSDTGFSTEEEREVYEAIIDSWWSHTDTGVVHEKTFQANGTMITRHKESFDSVGEEVWKQYLEKNDNGAIKIALPRADCTKVFILPASWDVDWKELYPEAAVLIGFSRVGFNTLTTEALIYVYTYYAPLAGGGHLVALHKKKDGWKIVEQKLIWIS